MSEGKEIQPEAKFVAGCRGLQEEFAQSRYPYILHRQQHHVLWQVLNEPAKHVNSDVVEQARLQRAAAAEASGVPEPDASGSETGADIAARTARSLSRVLVGGPPGCGKSVLLAATAESMRQRGWIVMYIPDATDITLKSKLFLKNDETGMYDTRDSAQNILRSMREAHAKQLEALPQQLDGGRGSLLQLCNVIDKGSDASVCNAVVRMKLELYRLPQATRSAVIIDNYNALYWKTAFGEVQGLDAPAADRVAGHRELWNRPIDAQELTLAANLRVLGDTHNGHTSCIVAGSASGQIPILPYNVAKDDYIRLPLPHMSVEELGSMLRYYRHVHALAPEQEITSKGIAAAHLLTQGNGYDVRRNLHYLLPYDPILDDLDSVGAAAMAETT